jgi:hypothetical protein
MRARIVSAEALLAARRPLAEDLGGPLALRGLDVQQQAARGVSRPALDESEADRERRVSAWRRHLTAAGAYVEMLRRRAGLS